MYWKKISFVYSIASCLERGLEVFPSLNGQNASDRYFWWLNSQVGVFPFHLPPPTTPSSAFYFDFHAMFTIFTKWSKSWFAIVNSVKIPVCPRENLIYVWDEEIFQMISVLGGVWWAVWRGVGCRRVHVLLWRKTVVKCSRPSEVVSFCVTSKKSIFQDFLYNNVVENGAGEFNWTEGYWRKLMMWVENYFLLFW